jgi:hypothetical protein
MAAPWRIAVADFWHSTINILRLYLPSIFLITTEPKRQGELISIKERNFLQPYRVKRKTPAYKNKARDPWHGFIVLCKEKSSPFIHTRISA